MKASETAGQSRGPRDRGSTKRGPETGDNSVDGLESEGKYELYQIWSVVSTLLAGAEEFLLYTVLSRQKLRNGFILNSM
jgi:hypothetical protein